jgi:hypothetical protein
VGGTGNGGRCTIMMLMMMIMIMIMIAMMMLVIMMMCVKAAIMSAVHPLALFCHTCALRFTLCALF